jgi:hypothetical protein
VGSLVGFRVALVQSSAPAPAPLSVGTRDGQEWDENGLKMKFCWCPPGGFTMGSPKEEPGRASDGREDQVQVRLSKCASAPRKKAVRYGAESVHRGTE